MTRWKSLNRPKSSGFHPGRTFAPEICFVRPLSGAMLYAYNRPGADLRSPHRATIRTTGKLRNQPEGQFKQHSLNGYSAYATSTTAQRRLSPFERFQRESTIVNRNGKLPHRICAFLGKCRHGPTAALLGDPRHHQEHRIGFRCAIYRLAHVEHCLKNHVPETRRNGALR